MLHRRYQPTSLRPLETIVVDEHNKPVGTYSVVNNNKDTGTFDVIIRVMSIVLKVFLVSFKCLFGPKDGQYWYEDRRKRSSHYIKTQQAQPIFICTTFLKWWFTRLVSVAQRRQLNSVMLIIKTQTYITNVNSEAGSYTVVADQAPQDVKLRISV